MISQLSSLGKTVFDGGSIDASDALFLLELKGNARYDLFHWANRIRLERLGPKVTTCSIISGRTGKCSEDCRFCAQSAHFNTDVQSSVASEADMIQAARRAIENGVDNFGIVTSGKRLTDDDIKELAPVIETIQQEGNISCCGSLGCINREQAGRLYELGIRHYNHNLETSRSYFPKIVTTHTYDDRINTVKAVKAAGMEICSGGIIGMGETLQDRVDLAVTLRELSVDCVPINFLNPIAGTPLAGAEPVSPLTALQTIAMFRFVLPDKHIKIAGGRENCLRDMQSWMFYAGASSTMMGNYLTTTGRDIQQDQQMLKDLEVL
ncbi:MAG: biotin synthase BioB [Phycisphaerae bacterium]|nr:biotin synthase BioB [Phycisphaerae bacterium]